MTDEREVYLDAIADYATGRRSERPTPDPGIPSRLWYVPQSETLDTIVEYAAGYYDEGNPNSDAEYHAENDPDVILNSIPRL